MSETKNKPYGVVANNKDDPYSDEVWWFETLEEALEWRSSWDYEGSELSYFVVVRLPITKEMLDKYTPDYLKD